MESIRKRGLHSVSRAGDALLGKSDCKAGLTGALNTDSGDMIVLGVLYTERKE